MNIYASSSNRRIIIKSKSQICLILEYKNGVSAQFKQVPASISLVPLLNKPIFGCLGLINIDKECFVGVVSSVSSIGSLDSALVYNIQKVSFYSIQSSRFDSLTDSDPDTVHPCWLLKRILESGSFYFSPDVDLTRSTQKRTLDLQYGFLPNSLFNKTDSMFVWNANLLSPLLVIREQELDLQQQEETDRASIFI